MTTPNDPRPETAPTVRKSSRYLAEEAISLCKKHRDKAWAQIAALKAEKEALRPRKEIRYAK